MKAVELGRSRGRLSQQPAENLFGWTVFILLLCGFAVACWIGTFYVFNHPEQPFNYQLLAKLKKLDAPKRFELTAAPSGEFLGADKLLERYGAMTASQLQDESNNLLRAYIRNYDHQINKIPYVVGKFTVLDAFPASDAQYFGSGMVVLAQSNDVPTLYIEYVFCAPADSLPVMKQVLTTGLGIELRRSYDLSAVVHVSAPGDGKLLLTCVPLLYGSYGQNGATFNLEPPEKLYVKAGLPIVTRGQLQSAEQRYTEYKQANGGTTAASKEQTNTSKLVVSATPKPTASPPLMAALRAELVKKPVPSATIRGATVLKPGSTPATTKPTTTPMKVAVATPPANTASTPGTTSKQGPYTQNFQSFLSASPTPALSGRVETWPTYRPGQMPRGRLLDISQGQDLADHGLGDSPVYLRGDFTVTAARENRAVLRSRQTDRDNTRIIVEYPKGLNVPKEGENFQRDAQRPFQVVDVRRGADGQLNIYVREITDTQ